MARKRTIWIAAGTGLAAGLIGIGVAAVLDDPEPEVQAVRVADAASSTETTTGGTETTTGRSEQVPGLEELSGTVRQDRDDDDDRDRDVDLHVDGFDLDFGPDSWVAESRAAEDYDGDGTVEQLRDELLGLEGTQATFRVRFDTDGDDAVVYVINDLPYRDVSGPAPWHSGDAATEEEIRAAAAAAVGPGARVVDLDAEDGSTVAWEAEVVDENGREYDVLLDAAGEIIDVRAD